MPLMPENKRYQAIAYFLKTAKETPSCQSECCCFYLLDHVKEKKI